MHAIIEFIILALLSAAAILSLFLSEPDNLNFAIICAGIIGLNTFWQLYKSYIEFRREKVLTGFTFRNLERETLRYVTLVRDIIYFSSDDWLPSDDAGFFSKKTATLITSKINLDMKAPILPSQTWREYLFRTSKNLQAYLESLMKSSEVKLDYRLLKIVESAQGTLLLKAIPSLIIASPIVDKEIQVNRPPIVLGMDKDSEDAVYKSLVDIYNLVSYVMKLGALTPSQWDLLNMKDSRRWPEKLQGTNRFK